MLPAREEKGLVFDDRAAHAKSVLVLDVGRWLVLHTRRYLRLLEEEIIRVQNLVAEILMRFAMERVSTRLGAQVDHAASELAPLRSQVVVLNLELADRVLGWNDDRQINVADVQRLAVQVFGAFVRKRTADLIIAPAKWVLPDRRAARMHGQRSRP